LNGDASSAGGECALAFDSRRKRIGRLPSLATIFSGDQFKVELAGVVSDGISHCDAVILIPECHAIEKTFGILVGKLERPALAGVGGFVDAGLIAGSGA
jgi:hypothetical protein